MQDKESLLYDWLEEITEEKGYINNLDTAAIIKNTNIKDHWNKLNFPITFKKEYIYTARNNFSKFPTIELNLIDDDIFEYFIEQLKKDRYNTYLNEFTGNIMVNNKEIEDL